MVSKPAFPLIVLFVLVSLAFFLMKGWFVAHGVDYALVLGGNLLLFIVSFISLQFLQKALVHQNTSGFLRNLYSGLLLKLFACSIAAFIYIYMVGGKVNTKALFICLFLYLVYTFLEMRTVMAASRRIKKNG